MEAIQNESSDITRIDLPENRQITIVGTAHVSRKSVELAEEIIREVAPDSVAVELCEPRFQSLRDPDRWKNTDIVQIIKEGKAYVLLVQLVLAGFQRKLGDHLQVKPGEEMMQAVTVAEELDIPVSLVDREVKITLKRIWGNLGLWSTIKVIGAMIGALFTTKEIDSEEIERLKSADALEELMKDFSDALPGVREALIDERDMYLAQKIKDTPGDSIVAIIGAGHVPGIKKWIHQDIALAPLEELPKPKKIRKVIAWSIPVLVAALIIYGFFSSGAETSIDMITAWVVINGVMGALGALLAGGHVITVLTALIASPFTSLNPFIAAGWVAGLVEASFRKPRVSDLEHIADDISTVRGAYRNRVSKILLVVCLTNLFGSIGTFIGLERIVHFARGG